MGCDIHLYVEHRPAAFGGRVWKSADAWTLDEPNDFDSDNEFRLHVRLNDRFYSGRNYQLFSILAGVRNGYGFAGVSTGTGFVPISEPRGLPEDVTDEVRKESDSWGSDGHSHSYLFLSEILEYDWTQITTRTAFVSAENYFEWNEHERAIGIGPKNFCGGVSGPGVLHVPERQMKEIIRLQPGEGYWEALSRIKTCYPHTYCQVEWEQPYYRAASEFWSCCIPRLLRLGDPGDVRIVFWFDN